MSAAAADKGVFQELTPSLPSGIEMARLVAEWNRTEVEFNHDGCVHQEIEARVSRAPERIALIFRKDALTYRELDQRAGQLDMARYRADGTVEFVGRADFQVKIHGFRIELGEIETVLGAHPGIREAVVMADASPAGEPQLAAYIAAQPEQGLSAAEVRIYARQKLPKHMLPARFTFLEAMPVTAFGKVDRKALSALRAGEQMPGSVEPGARTHLEKAIVAVWQGLLGVERIGLHSNFFDLGATSLIVAEAASGLREMLKREIKLTDLFGYPTVAALAAYLSRADSAKTPDSEAGRGAALAARASRTSGADHKAKN